MNICLSIFYFVLYLKYNGGNMNDKNLKSLFISLSGICFIFAGLYLDKGVVKKTTGFVMNNLSTSMVQDFNGVYKSDSAIAKIYDNNDDEASFYFEGNGKNETFENDSILKIKDGKLVGNKKNDSYTVELIGDIIKVTINGEGNITFILKKESDYDLDSYFMDKYGTDEYIGGMYTAQYKQLSNNDVSLDLYLIQKNDTEVTIIYGKDLDGPNESYGGSKTAIIQEDGSLSIDENIKIKFNEDILTITNYDEDDYLDKKIEGSYIKVKNLMKEDIIN